MKTRMRFTKTGSMKYIGHLDCMRFFQKVIRRAKLDVSYSQGFNPHQIMSFASPLSVGLTSDGEYIDIEFESLPEQSTQELVNYINQFTTEEIFVTELHILDDKAKTSMALLNACDYLITWKDGGTLSDNMGKEIDFEKEFEAFVAQEQILITKKTKRSETEVDIKPHILKYAFTEDSYREKFDSFITEFNNEFDSEEVLFLQLTSGSATNIKPELVLQAFFQYLGMDEPENKYQVHRLQMYFNE